MNEEKEKEEVKEEKPRDVLTKAWPELHYEGICPDFYFYCKGFTRGEKETTLIDAVVVDPKAPRDKWRYEGAVKITGPVIIHPIVR